MIRLAAAAAAVALLLLATLFPFLPGRHDPLAISVSVLAQALGFLGLVLVPFGLAWLVHGAFFPTGDPMAAIVRRRYSMTVSVVLLVLGLFGALLALAQGGVSLGIATAAAAALVSRAAFCWRKRRIGLPGPDRATPLGCVVAPVVLLLLQFAVAAPATAFARDRAIRNSAALVADIEQFRATRGQYPLSLHSLWEDYQPDVIGVPRFHYELHGDAYNLFFEMATFEFGARVIVMFHPRDQQAFSSHDTDLLRLAPADVERQRGFIAVHELPQPHWKAFVFD